MNEFIKKLLRESILKSPFKGRNILYHSTYIDRVIKIISDNKIEAKTTQKILTKFNDEGKNYNGISLTRNVNLRFSDIQLILDGDTIKRDFGKRLVPHNYFAQFGDEISIIKNDESEEFFIGTLEPISKYLLGVRFTSSNVTIEDFKVEEPELFYLFKNKLGDIPFYGSDFTKIQL